MYTGPLPQASTHGTWSENLEVWSVDDDTLMDLSGVTEITLSVRDPLSKLDSLTLKLSEGTITIPSQGIIQWRAEVEQMRILDAKTYDVIMVMEDEDDAVPLIMGSISIIE